MDQDLIIVVAKADQMLAKVDEVRDRGLEVVGVHHTFRSIFVRGDPRKLEGMTGVQIRKTDIMRTME